jgi:RNA polymerase sigma-70 factor (ECF subfamily)
MERPENVAASELFEAAAMPHLNDLFRTALHVLGERGLAEDAVQEVYLQAWKSFANFETGTNCRAWLFGILFNCIRHQRRKLFRFSALKPNEEFLETNLAGTPEIPEKLSDRDVLAALDAISGRLPDSGAAGRRGGVHLQRSGRDSFHSNWHGDVGSESRPKDAA